MMLSMGRLAVVLLGAACLSAGGAAFGHEVRPAYLELAEGPPGEFSVLWKTPMRGDLRLSIAPLFPEGVEPIAPVVARQTGDAAVQTWRVRANAPMRGGELRVQGLEATMTDALVRISFADGSSWTARLTPQSSAAAIPEQPSAGGVSGLYFKLGVEHILLGYDHLLFVLALLIVTRGGWKIVRTVTAFTISHSVTLSLAALGFVRLPTKPVEAIIALSIVFVAAEIVQGYRGREGLTARAPWIVAFSFGLLHGLGFAGALSEIGLPETHIPLALLFFSVGVEAGHFLFVAAMLALIAGLKRTPLSAPRWAALAPAYAIGAVASYWFIDRLASF